MPLVRLAGFRLIRLGAIALSAGRRSHGKGYHCDDYIGHRLCTGNPIRHCWPVSIAVMRIVNQMDRSLADERDGQHASHVLRKL